MHIMLRKKEEAKKLMTLVVLPSSFAYLHTYSKTAATLGPTTELYTRQHIRQVSNVRVLRIFAEQQQIDLKVAKKMEGTPTSYIDPLMYVIYEEVPLMISNKDNIFILLIASERANKIVIMKS